MKGRKLFDYILQIQPGLLGYVPGMKSRVRAITFLFTGRRRIRRLDPNRTPLGILD